jgi:class 3 adenylate cyclase/predicted ATPase
MRCPKCGAENPPKNKFCGECGTKLPKVSAKDRIDLVRKDIPESLIKKILLTKDTIEKERKDVTVIFSDISGFTSMSEKLDPEELTFLMNDCFRKLSASVYRYEGIIDKFIGDCIMAIFGAPVTHEDDPERAILACLDMQIALNDINKNLAKSLKKLSIHSGINTGQVIAGKMGSDLQMEYTVMGDTVNVAQRLKDTAPRGNILVGPETYNRTRHAFDFMSLEPVQLKGKAELVRPYEVIGRKLGSEFGLSAIRSDLIGRDQEFLQLKQGYNDLINKKPSIYIIKGEIGVGKSRLLYEFKKFLSIAAPDITLIDGRSVSYESTIPYKTFADSLKNLFLDGAACITDDANKIIKEKIESLLGEETADVAPYIYKLLNIELDEKHLEKIKYLDSHSLQLQIFLAVTTLFEKISEDQPAIFIIDDIQWVDAASLELINFLLPMVKKTSMSFYLSYRIGDLASIKTIVSTIQNEFKKYMTKIDLKNLGPQDSTRLIENLIGKDVDAAFKNYIIEKSEGNPFFIEEIVRNIIESEPGTIKKDTIEKIQVPGSIEAAVNSRIDSLKKETKYLLRIASIISHSFPRELLKEIVKEKDVYQYIDELESSEFLIKTTRGNITYYTFRHALFQEVAYNSLLKSERVIYHKVIAETIERKFKDKIDGINTTLAHHYYNCKNSQKTLEYSLRSGDEASDLFANEEALKHYNTALSVADENRHTILEKIANVEATIGKSDTALKHYQEARELAADKLDKARLGGKIAHLLTQTGKIDEGLVLTRNIIDAIKDKDTAVLADIKYHYAHDLLEFKADIAQAEKLIEDGIRISKIVKNESLEAAGLRMKGHALWRKGMSDEALKVLKKCINLYESVENQRKLSETYTLIAVVYRSVGNLRMAIDYVKKAITVSKKIGDQLLLGNGYNNLGVYYGIMGENQTAIDYYKKNLEIKQRISDKRGEAIVLFNIGVANDDNGELNTALEYYNKAKDLFESVNDIRSMIVVYPTIANKLVKKGKPEEVGKYFEKSLNLAKETKDNAMVSEAYRYYAHYLIGINNLNQALELLKQAEAMTVQAGDKNRLAQVSMGLAEVYLKMKDPEAVKYAEDGLKYAVEAKVKRDEIEALRIQGQVQALISKNYDEGIKNIKRSIALAKETNLVAKRAVGLLALGEVLIAYEKSKEALVYLRQAEEIFSKGNYTVPLEKVKALIKTIS